MSMDWLSASSPLIIGHRGASADMPENSLAAFALALEQGADGIEMDVQLSADGWPVVIHDLDVNRLTKGNGRVSELTVAELQALDLGEAQRIPTLDEIFEMFGHQSLYNVEIKDFGWRDRGTEAAIADRIEAYHLEDKVVVSSFNPFSVRRARRYLTRRTAVALIHSSSLFKYGYWFIRSEVEHPHHSLIDQKYMAWATKHNYRVHTWTVDDPIEAQRLANLGVHAIVTNKPQLICETLRPSS